MRKRPALLLLVLLTVTACGSTVQQRTTSTSGLGDTGAAAGSSAPGAAAGQQQGAGAPLGTGTGTGTGIGSTTGSGTAGPAAQGGAGATTAGTGEVAGTGATAGGAQTTGPVKVGVVLTDVGDLSAYGFSTGQAYTERAVDQALFDAINKRGGVLGRKLVPVFATTHTTSTNWSADFAQACATFTQDNHVQAVLGYDFNWDQAFESCLSKAGIVHVETGYNVPDASELGKHPLHRALSVPNIDVRTTLKLTHGLEDGLVTSKHKLGVVIDTCPGTQSSWKRVGEPFLKSHGIGYFVYESTCASGDNADTAAQVNGVNGIIVKFRQAGVDTLTFLATSEGPALAVVATAADSQNWHPNYVVSSLANLSALEGHTPDDQLAKVHGYGWLSSQDVGATRQPARWAGQKQCLSDLRSAGVDAKQFGDLTAAYRICTAVYAYVAAVTKTGGDVSGRAVVDALDHLGTALSSPDALDGASDLTAARANSAPAHLRRVLFNPGCTCFLYSGPTLRLS